MKRSEFLSKFKIGKRVYIELQFGTQEWGKAPITSHVPGTIVSRSPKYNTVYIKFDNGHYRSTPSQDVKLDFYIV